MCTYYVAMMPSSKNSHFVDADETWRVCFHAAVITPVPWSLKCTGPTSEETLITSAPTSPYDQPQRELTSLGIGFSPLRSTISP